MQDFLTSALAWAAQTPTEGSPTGEAAPPPVMLYMMIAIMFMFYFLVWRPQKAEQRRREAMMNQLAKGDQVVTAGGIHGTVEAVDQSAGIVTVNVAPKISLRFSRSSIASLTSKKNKTGEEATAKSSGNRGE